MDEFKIPNYNIFLPTSWDIHGVARMIVYARQDLKVNVVKDKNDDADLQHILLSIGQGKNEHFIDMYYREWKSCVSGQNSQRFHIDYFQRLTNIWRQCTSKQKDFLSIGDTNIDMFKANKPHYKHQSVADVLNDFLYEENSYQLVEEATRIRKVNDSIQKSCLDHVSTNCVSKVSQCSVQNVGDSDHLGLVVSKRAKEIVEQKRSTKRRVYKNFDADSFLQQLRLSKEKEISQTLLQHQI